MYTHVGVECADFIRLVARTLFVLVSCGTPQPRKLDDLVALPESASSLIKAVGEVSTRLAARAVMEKVHYSSLSCYRVLRL